ncbi:MAG: hypothetical protein ACYC49_19050 [Ignavibacteriaceae bacterium]
MGQQQLLLIVLGVIIVGIAIVVGINLFNANAISANRDAVVSDLNNLAAMAHQYYLKPTSMGGGGNDYTNWDITTTGFTKVNSTTVSTPNGEYVESAGSLSSVTITGTGKQVGKDGTNMVKAVMLVKVPPAVDSVGISN